LKTAYLNTRIEPKTKLALTKLAKQLEYSSVGGMTRSLFHEALTGLPALDGARYNDIRRIRWEIHKVGVNLNQIAYALNMDHRPQDAEVITEVIACKAALTEAMRAYSELLRKTKSRKLRRTRR